MCMLDEIRAMRDEIYAIAGRLKAEKLWVSALCVHDALHLACAEAAECDWFFTTDRGILKKARSLTPMRVANPVEFFGGD